MLEVSMSIDTSSEELQTKGASQFNARLPQLTHTQINELVQEYGLTKTQVIIVAVDRLKRELDTESELATKDVRRLKTVARIVPQFDLGQED
jgi:NifB/MoaA-like Fe-S oxidoreductase